VRILETDDIKEILKRNEGGEFGLRNQVAILAAALWGVTAAELSRIGLGDVLDAKGQLRSTFHVGASIAHNGYEREIPLDPSESKRLTSLLEQYLAWRVERGVGVVKSARYRGLDPKLPLLLNDRGEAFGFTRRSKASEEDLQPSGMNLLFRQMIGRTKFAGIVTYKDFRRSFIVHMGRADEGGLSTRNLMAVTGIRDYASLKKHLDLDSQRVTKQVKGIYKRL
jgi:integrase